MSPCNLNTITRQDHVREVERSIWTVKEPVRCTLNGLPLKQIPKIMIKSMVIRIITQLKHLPKENGISTEISPNAIVIGRTSPEYNIISRISFGTYTQANEDHDP